MSTRNDLLPSLGILFAAILWGLFWIPVRGIQEAGVDAVWSSVLIFAFSTILFLPAILFRWKQLFSGGRDLLLASTLAGLAFALYTVSLNLTDVIRALLLFYMAPLWSTLLGVLILNERLNINRILGLILAFLGLMVILGVDYQIPIPSNVGDWFALLSGFLWSCASVRLFQGGATLLFEKVFMFVFFALVFSLVLIFLPLGLQSQLPVLENLIDSWIWVLIITIVMLPMVYLTIWPATVLSPGRVAILLMADVLAGAVSAALLADENFGYRELIGTVLIMSAGIVEVVRQQTVTRDVAVN